MKKIYILAIAVIASLSLNGCSKFLKVEPEGVPTVDNYFKVDQEAVNAIKSLYAPLYDGDACFGREIYWEQEAGNQMVPGKSRGWTSTLLTMKYTGDESPLAETYQHMMEIQSRANWVVDALLQKQKQEKELSAIMTRSLGEAYFVRGFCHFMIAYRYGTDKLGVPAVKYEEWREAHNGKSYLSEYEIPTQQKTVMVNYDMIIKDFEKAKEYLPKFETYGADDRGRAHKAAAVGMEARVYAYWATWDKSKWNDVIEVVNSLEKDYGRGLANSYSKLFGTDWNPGPDGWWGPEYIWSFPSNGGAGWQRGGVEWPGVVLENTGWEVYNGWGQNKPTLDAYREFIKDGRDSTQNERLFKSILQYNQEFIYPTDKTLKEVGVRHFFSSQDIETGFQINKWMEPWSFPNCVTEGYVNSSGDWPTARCNFPVLRFADALLLRAEAYLNSPDKTDKGKAMADINRLRARVNLPAITEVSMQNIYHERYCELAYEPASDHLADLKRWAVSGDATIKALAVKELTKHPDVRHYLNRSDPNSALDPKYDYEKDEGSPYLDESMRGKAWADYKIAFPYPSNEITKSNGALKQNYGY